MKRIELTRGKQTLVDDADYEVLSKYKWWANHAGNDNFYAARMTPRDSQTGKQKMILMHREIMRTPLGLVVDHLNCDTLDNRRVNLKNCSARENVIKAIKRTAARARNSKGPEK